MKEQLTREEIKAHQGSKQESPSLETAVLVVSLQDIKGFGWINLSSNTCIFQHIMMPSAFGEKNIVFLNRVGVITGEGIILGSTLQVPPPSRGMDHSQEEWEGCGHLQENRVVVVVV